MTSTLTPLRQVGRTVRHSAYERTTTHAVEFDREITETEFTAWLEAHHWLSHHPAGYGPVTITVRGCIGRYEHSTSTGD